MRDVVAGAVRRDESSGGKKGEREEEAGLLRGIKRKRAWAEGRTSSPFDPSRNRCPGRGASSRSRDGRPAGRLPGKAPWARVGCEPGSGLVSKRLQWRSGRLLLRLFRLTGKEEAY